MSPGANTLVFVTYRENPASRPFWRLSAQNKNICILGEIIYSINQMIRRQLIQGVWIEDLAIFKVFTFVQLIINFHKTCSIYRKRKKKEKKMKTILYVCKSASIGYLFFHISENPSIIRLIL